MHRLVGPTDVLAAADVAVEALTAHIDDDWSVQAGTLEWDVERTISHMIGAPAKYTLYLASGSQTFIAMSVSRWPDATHAEIVDSIRPIVQGLVSVARWAPPDSRAFHASGLTDVSGFLGMACFELLLHTHDALQGFGERLGPPEDLAQAVLEAEFPAAPRNADAWGSLLAASGRPR